MQKRSWIGCLLMIGLFMIFSSTGFAATAKYNWKLASVLPDSHPVHRALVYFAEQVGEQTKGEVKITVYPAGQLGQEKDYIEGVKVGAIEITEVADPGLLGTPEARMDFGGDTRVYAMAASMKGGAEPESVKVVPEEIEIGAQLQLRFRSVES